ncbi:unnamed protein product [Medioppia subpectinata]|uniref:Uncharacterized protein n=1 Tax=Medioppia subpectinata TaxID=1979941 RepID=A0A7R9Q768_9ACAR|nr:unnamed protein product [Medioppia subpectinata]CAG2114489.1 unnamed protein product [Medioppia subpectinata]
MHLNKRRKLCAEDTQLIYGSVSAHVSADWSPNAALQDNGSGDNESSCSYLSCAEDLTPRESPVPPIEEAGGDPLMSNNDDHSFVPINGDHPLLSINGDHPLLPINGDHPLLPINGDHPLLSINGDHSLISNATGVETDDSCLDWSECNQTLDESTAGQSVAITPLDTDKRIRDFMDLLDRSRRFSAVIENNLRQRSHEMIQTNGTCVETMRRSGHLMAIDNKQVICSAIDDESSKDGADSEADSVRTFDTSSSTSSTENHHNGIAVDSRQPYLISGTIMRDYQLDGLEWMRLLMANCMNGILADEMGLGKTIQSIAMIAHIVENSTGDAPVGPFLVIAPLTTLHNWKRELVRFAPLIPGFVFHGNDKQRRAMFPEFRRVANVHFGVRQRRRCLPVVITSYDIIRRCVGTMMKYKWAYVVVDEGHKIKNINCQLSKVMRKIKSANRLILTGTPLHNNLAELWALLNYVSPDVFSDWKIFEDLLVTTSSNEHIIQQEMQNKIISSIHQILAPFMLRRTKSEVGLNLPPKKEFLLYAPSTRAQQALYEAAVKLVKEARERKSDAFTVECALIDGRKPRKSTKPINYKQYYKEFEEWLADEENGATQLVANYDTQIRLPKELVAGGQQYVSFGKFNRYNILMQMRKITNHPYLIQWPDNWHNEEIVRLSGKMRALDELLKHLYVGKHRVILFSQMTRMLNIIEEYCHYRKYTYLRFDGSTRLDVRQQYIDEFNKNPNIFLFLVSTRAGGLGINLCGADTAIIYDSDWNPQMDLQAQDRCHRIGQSKPVIVYRLVTAHTIDDKILQTANKKRKLDKMIIQKGQSLRSSSRLSAGDDHNTSTAAERTMTIDELMNILESTDFKAIYNYSAERLESDRLYSDEDLLKMLDREANDDLNQSVIKIGSQYNRSQE